MDQEQRIAFVHSHRTAVFGINRKNDGPGMSVVYYVMDGNDILISTMEGRGKAKAVSCLLVGGCRGPDTRLWAAFALGVNRRHRELFRTIWLRMPMTYSTI